MVKDLKSVKRKVTKNIQVKSDTIEMLLFNFLQELIFHKDANLLLFSKFEIKIKKNDAYTLKTKAHGEKINMKKHELLVDVKAVSMHSFKVLKTKSGWKANVILDV
jgi:SHS2 domain-containing protein